MDPLSVSASIAGLIMAAMQVSKLLYTLAKSADGSPSSAQRVLAEVNDIRVCLEQLQSLVLGKEDRLRSRKSLVMVEQLIVVLTNCVSIFSELEQTLEMVKTDQPMRVIDRLKWISKESVITRILLRLQTSKSSLNLMITTLTCATVDEAHESVRNLTNLVQQVLKANIDMSRRLKNIERMHPALASSTRTSINQSRRTSKANELQRSTTLSIHGFIFEPDLQASRVYRKVAMDASKLSILSNGSSIGLSSLSGLSLSDVSNVSAIALPISPSELWNHHRYNPESSNIGHSASSPLEAWYNPPPRRSAFIRTEYCNGQYTNQYAQCKYTGHLIYRRFTITNTGQLPAFLEGAPLKPIKETVIEAVESSINNEGQRNEAQITGSKLSDPYEDILQTTTKDKSIDVEHVFPLFNMENSLEWGRGVLTLLQKVDY